MLLPKNTDKRVKENMNALFLRFLQTMVYIPGKGQNYEFHNVEIQKERRKKFKASERRNCLFSFSLLRNQNVENGFLVDQNVENE
jgi:hypothetical protein